MGELRLHPALNAAKYYVSDIAGRFFSRPDRVSSLLPH